MILPEVYRSLRSSICAIVLGGSDFWSEESIRQKVLPEYDVFGTGFLIDDGVVITNKHVLNVIQQYPSVRVAVMFISVDLNNVVTQSIHAISFKSSVNDSPDVSDNKTTNDIAFLAIDQTENLVNEIHRPVKVGSHTDIQIGKNIAACGYIHGNDLLSVNQEAIRFEPLLLQGHIAGLYPFDNIHGNSPKLILTDITNGGGLSGSPIFLDNGDVIAIHCAGREHEVFGMPIDQQSQPTIHRVTQGIGYAIPITGDVFKSAVGQISRAFKTLSLGGELK